MLLDEIDVDVCQEGVRALANAVRGLDYEFREFRQRIAAATGISLAEFDALSAVAWASGDVTPKRIAEVAHLTTGAMTAMLDRLTTAGLLQRQPHPTDRRSVLITLTDAGHDIVAQVYRSYVRAFESVAARAGQQDVRAMIDSLGHLADAVSHADDEFHPAEPYAGSPTASLSRR
ncbi:MAG: MarR family transcriptional regulator [Actinomycetota bacterium]|nr:MarR family transcriptional regulator [Actinomycetota bacterium]